MLNYTYNNFFFHICLFKGNLSMHLYIEYLCTVLNYKFMIKSRQCAILENFCFFFFEKLQNHFLYYQIFALFSRKSKFFFFQIIAENSHICATCKIKLINREKCINMQTTGGTTAKLTPFYHQRFSGFNSTRRPNRENSTRLGAIFVIRRFVRPFSRKILGRPELVYARSTQRGEGSKIFPFLWFICSPKRQFYP